MENHLHSLMITIHYKKVITFMNFVLLNQQYLKIT